VWTVVDHFVLRGCQVVTGTVQPSVVVPVDPFQAGQLDIVEAVPGALSAGRNRLAAQRHKGRTGWV
jgi:hypothetical protein